MGDKDNNRPMRGELYGHPRFDNSVTWVRYLAQEEEERRLDLKLPDDVQLMRMDKRALRRAVDELNEQMGFVPVPGMTPEKAQQMMLDEGIDPEQNIASCEIKRMRTERNDV